MPAGPEPGWYLDRDGGATERYWNGTSWTEHRKVVHALPQVPASPSGGFKGFWLGLSDAARGWIVIGIIAAVVIIGILVFTHRQSDVEKACTRQGR